MSWQSKYILYPEFHVEGPWFLEKMLLGRAFIDPTNIALASTRKHYWKWTFGEILLGMLLYNELNYLEHGLAYNFRRLGLAWETAS